MISLILRTLGEPLLGYAEFVIITRFPTEPGCDIWSYVARLGHNLVGRVGRYTDLVGCVLAQPAVSRGSPRPAFSSLREPSPRL